MKFFGKRRGKLSRVDGDDERIVQLIGLHSADAVIDVGANVGQFAQRLRSADLGLPILSIEPGAMAHAVLAKASASDPNWRVAPPMALGDASGSAQLQVNIRSDMSSLKTIAEATIAAFPKAKPVGIEEVRLERLDGILAELADPHWKSLFLKIDSQGSEAEILRGAHGILDRVVGVQMEMSLLPLYHGEPIYLAHVNELDRLGYDLQMVIPGFFSRSLGRQLQFDGLFFRRPS